MDSDDTGDLRGSAGHDPDALARLIADLADHLAEIGEVLAPVAGPTVTVPDADLAREATNRELAVGALELLRTPATTRLLRALIEARYARDVTPQQFGTLARDERAAFARIGMGGRRVWLCNCLAHDTLRPVPRYRALSTWPLEERILAPGSPERIELRIAERLCTIASQIWGAGGDTRDLQTLALHAARGLPGMVPGRKVDLARVAREASRLIAEFDPDERLLRQDAARRLVDEPVEVQLFGK